MTNPIFSATLALFAGLAMLGGCASADDTENSGDEADITAVSHGDALKACVKTESTAQGDRAAVYAKTETCIRSANNRTVAQISKRSHGHTQVTTSASDVYRAFVTSETAFCRTSTTASDAVARAKCARDAEYELAVLLQRHAQLGGANPVGVCTVLPCAPSDSEIRQCSFNRSTDRSTDAGYVTCVETRLGTVATQNSVVLGDTAKTALAKASDFCDILSYKTGEIPVEQMRHEQTCFADVGHFMVDVLTP